MKAVMYGAGNIGRGFVGALLAQSGYDVLFIDVAKPVVEALHTRGSYPLRILDGETRQDAVISNVDAIDGNDTEAVARAIADADIMATAVGANVLKFIAPNIAAGLRLRFRETEAPLDVVICENLMDANRVLEGLIKARLTEEERALFDARVGLVEASIGRMVPVQTPDMQDGDALRVCVERYGYLPVDRDAFKGGIPDIKNLVPYSPFDFYIRRKLYLHNMGHAVCAYLGLYAGKEFICEAIDDAEIYIIALNAMIESARALSGKYGVPLGDILPHLYDLLARFANPALRDTCARVGGDPVRKLSPQDRLIGPALLCAEQGIAPAYLCAGIAAALHAYLKENGLPRTAENASQALLTLSQLDARSNPLGDRILAYYALLAAGQPIPALRRAAQRVQADENRGVI